MPLFGKTNKSQASLLNAQESVGNLTKSPQQSPADSPVHSPAYQYPAPPQLSFREAPEPQGQAGYQNFDQGHPAHSITRSQSHRLSTGSSNAYQRPSVNVTAPTPRDSRTIFEYPPPPQDQTNSSKSDKEHKKNKRGIFGIHSSSAKEAGVNIQPPPKAVGRNPSLLRKPPPDTQDQRTPGGPQYPQIQTSSLRFPPPNQEEAQSSSEHIPISGTDEDFSHEQFYHQPGQYEENHLNTDQNQALQTQSPQYIEDVPAQYTSQAAQYRPFNPPPPPKNNSNTYLPYQAQGERLSSGTFDRPSSRQSVDPPSPILPALPLQDSRPSTSTSAANAQSRFSAQSAPPQSQTQPAMARGDQPPNAGMRMNPPHMPQRMDSGQMDGSQDSYGVRPPGPPPGPRPQLSQQLDQGRSTPPLSSRNREDLSNLDYPTLVQKYEELQAKYSKVKRYYFEKDHQVVQLQNIIANQRLSMSKTTFDDNEYVGHFSRLDGAISNLSYLIRKNWKGVPPWLAAYVNKDAHTLGTKEMLAVGRAHISRWVFDEILDRFFHPGLGVTLSTQLKLIEKTIRRMAQNASIQTDENRDDMRAKLSNWRLTTLEGLQESLVGHQANENKTQLTHSLVEKLTASLQMSLTDPTPQALESGVVAIVEGAIKIAAALPLESRDVCVDYFMPGAPINEAFMKLEAGLPALTNPGPDYTSAVQQDQADRASTMSGISRADTDNSDIRDQAALEIEIRDTTAKATAPLGGAPGRNDPLPAPPGQGSKDKQKKQSFLGGFVNKKPAPPTSADSGPGVSSNRPAGMAMKESGDREREIQEMIDKDREGAIRFALFVCVSVRGKDVLFKAPVFGY